MNSAEAGAQRWLDGVAIAGSLACMAHCLALPLVIAALPALSSWLEVSEDLHVWMLMAAVPFSTFVLWRHSWRQGRPVPLVMGVAGLAGMVAALAFEGSPLEAVLTGAGAIVLVSAHIFNWRGSQPCPA